MTVEEMAAMVQAIHGGTEREREQGTTDLYLLLNHTARYMFARERFSREDIDDNVNAVFIVLLKAIQSGAIRDPIAFPGYLRTVVKRVSAQMIRGLVQGRTKNVDLSHVVDELSTTRNGHSEHPFVDPRANPEKVCYQGEQFEILKQALQALRKRDREILERFYLDGQDQETIQREIGISYTQFRLIKSRAKAKAGKIGQALIAGRGNAKQFLENAPVGVCNRAHKERR